MNRYFIEFRDRLIRCLLLWVVIFVTCFIINKPLWQHLSAPLLQHLPPGHHIVATQVTTPILVPIRVALVMSILLSIPFWSWHFWRFVAPALYPQEQKTLLPLIFATCGSFYLGNLFGFKLLSPLIIQSLILWIPQDVIMMADMNQYLDFIFSLTLAGGIIFQIPILCVLATKIGLVSPTQLSQARPILIIAAFILGMILTPPDVVSQILLAIPICVLFEMGIRIAQRTTKAHTPTPIQA